jgi:hypothetical protein
MKFSALYNRPWATVQFSGRLHRTGSWIGKSGNESDYVNEGDDVSGALIIYTSFLQLNFIGVYTIISVLTLPSRPGKFSLSDARFPEKCVKRTVLFPACYKEVNILQVSVSASTKELGQMTSVKFNQVGITLLRRIRGSKAKRRRSN